MENTPNPKCTRCKCYWKPDDTDIKTSGLVCKTCKKCRDNDIKYKNNNKCPHGREKSKCIDCGGACVCPHNRMKYRCRDCRGVCICPHDRIRIQCRDCEPILYLIQLQRSQMQRCFNNSNLDKTNPSISYLSCDIKYFKEYFQKKMDLFNKFSEIEMTWDNIHIDHIKPVSAFNLDVPEEMLDCCHYTNLQPLLAETNLNKSCKWNDKAEEFWCNNIKGKEYLDIFIPD